MTDSELMSYLVTLLADRGEPTASQLLADWWSERTSFDASALDIVRRHIRMATPPYKTNQVTIFVDNLRVIEKALISKE